MQDMPNKLDSCSKITHRVPSVFLVGIDSSVSESISMSPAAPDAPGGTAAGKGAAAPPRAALAPVPALWNIALSPVFNIISKLSPA